jgi:hypothetical protein
MNNNMKQYNQPMVVSNPNIFQISIIESIGVAHEKQVLFIDIPQTIELPEVFTVVDGDLVVLGQRSTADRNKAFLYLSISPFDEINLTLGAKQTDINPQVNCFIKNEVADISNENFALRVVYGAKLYTEPKILNIGDLPGVILNCKETSGQWRGKSYIDTHEAVESITGEIIEQGPIRIIYRYTVKFVNEKYYTADVTVDAGMQFAVISESFSAGIGDQIIWDFSAENLPDELYLLDSTPLFSTQPLSYFYDSRIARLAMWTQYSQLKDFSDGYAFRIQNSQDVIGFITLEGGTWYGNRLNQMDLWCRRWVAESPATRRLHPAESKADAFPSVDERIPGRGVSRNQPHLTVEGWIEKGRRKFALLISTTSRIKPQESTEQNVLNMTGCEPKLGHFDMTPQRELYKRSQSLLRKIHTQFGMYPLADMAKSCFIWNDDFNTESSFSYPNDIFIPHLHHDKLDVGIATMKDFIDSRIYGFWEGGGSAHTNCVVSRPVAPLMFRLTVMMRSGEIAAEDMKLFRAHFAFLSYMFESDNYYPGWSTMLPVGDDNSTEPTWEGMPNQNFYTDVITLYGTAAQLFPAHPQAAVWQEKFIKHWHRQLAYHMYPESGIWEESHTYYHHVLHTVLPLLLRRKADEVDDEFTNPAFQQLASSALHQLTPPDAYFDNCRHIVPFGDHNVEINHFQYLYHILSVAFAGINPLLSGQFAWAYRGLKGEKPLSVDSIPLPWKSEYLQGLGVMFRDKNIDGTETLLAFRSGSAWGHHHNDDGSIQFYTHNRAMIVDAGFSERNTKELKFAANGHSRWSTKHNLPQDHLWRFTRGRVVADGLDAAVPFITSFNPVYAISMEQMHARVINPGIHSFRTVIQLSSDSFMIIDRTTTPVLQETHFHIPGTAINIADNGEITRNWEDSALLIKPLYPLNIPITTTVIPASNRENVDYTTTRVTFDIDTTPLSAYIISAIGKNESFPEIIINADNVAININGKELLIKLLLDNVAICDNEGMNLVVPLSLYIKPC